MSTTPSSPEAIVPAQLPNFEELFTRFQNSRQQLQDAQSQHSLSSTVLRGFISRNSQLFFDVVGYPTNVGVVHDRGGVTFVSCTRIRLRGEEDKAPIEPSVMKQTHVYLQGDDTFYTGDLRVSGSELDKGGGWIIPLHRLVSIQISDVQEPLPPIE